MPPIEKPVGGGNSDNNKGKVGGLTIGAWAGIAIAGATVLTLFIFLVSRGRRRGDEDDDADNDANMDLDDDAASVRNARKELAAINTNGDLVDDAPPSQDSPDATNSMTASDVSSIPSMGTSDGKGTAGAAKSAYYAKIL